MEMNVVHSAAIATLLKRDCKADVFLWNIANILRTASFYRTHPMAASGSQRIRLLNTWKLK